jgi:hypothetical protein
MLRWPRLTFIGQKRRTESPSPESEVTKQAILSSPEREENNNLHDLVPTTEDLAFSYLNSGEVQPDIMNDIFDWADILSDSYLPNASADEQLFPIPTFESERVEQDTENDNDMASELDWLDEWNLPLAQEFSSTEPSVSGQLTRMLPWDAGAPVILQNSMSHEMQCFHPTPLFSTGPSIVSCTMNQSFSTSTSGVQRFESSTVVESHELEAPCDTESQY